MCYKLLPISEQLFWNILEKFHFIILLESYGISSKILNLLFLALSAHNLYHRLRFFYIDGTKNAKASFWSLKGYKVFYIKFHSVQQNELYAFIQVICLHPYPINIVSDSIYFCFCIKKYRNLHHKLQSTCYSTTLFQTTICCQKPQFSHLYYTYLSTFLSSWPHDLW